jgi:hypothetical protein
MAREHAHPPQALPDTWASRFPSPIRQSARLWCTALRAALRPASALLLLPSATAARCVASHRPTGPRLTSELHHAHSIADRRATRHRGPQGINTICRKDRTAQAKSEGLYELASARRLHGEGPGQLLDRPDTQDPATTRTTRPVATSRVLLRLLRLLQDNIWQQTRPMAGNYARPSDPPSLPHKHIYEVALTKRARPAKRVPRHDVAPAQAIGREWPSPTPHGRCTKRPRPPAAQPPALRSTYLPINLSGRQSCRATPNITPGFGHPPRKK